MKVFISWSGKKSKEVGELLCEWLQCVIQAIEPWMSSKDIDRGSLWFSQINNQLKDTSIGIVCVTSSNLFKPWILFEAGALAKGLSSNRVCTFLVDITPTDISDPLAQFNHTMPTKDGLWGLVLTLNNSLGDKKLGDKIIESVFNTYWPQFESKFSQILINNKDDSVIVDKKEEDILGEVLYMTRRMDKRLRALEENNQIKLATTDSRESATKSLIDYTNLLNKRSEEILTRNIDKVDINRTRRILKDIIERETKNVGIDVEKKAD